jgi:hypothetical protein
VILAVLSTQPPLPVPTSPTQKPNVRAGEAQLALTFQLRMEVAGATQSAGRLLHLVHACSRVLS